MLIRAESVMKETGDKRIIWITRTIGSQKYGGERLENRGQGLSRADPIMDIDSLRPSKQKDGYY